MTTLLERNGLTQEFINKYQEFLGTSERNWMPETLQLKRMTCHERGLWFERLVADELNNAGWTTNLTALIYPYDIRAKKNGRDLKIEVKSAVQNGGGGFLMHGIKPFHINGGRVFDLLVCCCLHPTGIKYCIFHNDDIPWHWLSPKIINGKKSYNLCINKHFEHPKYDCIRDFNQI